MGMMSISDKYFQALSLLFIGLKLGKVIDWSWIVVLSPLWAPVILLLFVLLVGDE